MSITGEEIVKYKLDAKNSIFNIPETALSEGVYIYKIFVNNELFTADKLIIIK